MATISNLKRIIKEDFPQEYAELIDKISFVINPAFEQIASAFNKNINIDNLSREIIQFTIENTSGSPKIPVQFKVGLTGRIIGLNCIRAENLSSIGTYPTQAPFVSWTINGSLITVKKVTGIQDEMKYRLTMEVIS